MFYPSPSWRPVARLTSWRAILILGMAVWSQCVSGSEKPQEIRVTMEVDSSLDSILHDVWPDDSSTTIESFIAERIAARLNECSISPLKYEIKDRAKLEGELHKPDSTDNTDLQEVSDLPTYRIKLSLSDKTQLTDTALSLQLIGKVQAGNEKSKKIASEKLTEVDAAAQVARAIPSLIFCFVPCSWSSTHQSDLASDPKRFGRALRELSIRASDDLASKSCRYINRHLRRLQISETPRYRPY
jgi:hypothetical protein